MGKFLNNALRNLFVNRLKKRGYSSFFAKAAVNNRYEDLFKNKNTTLAQKIWAQKRGFLSDRISFYGLTENNYRDYLSDFDYYRLHPINGPYSKWIDDKLTIRYLLAPFSRYLPEYYYHIYGTEVLRLVDCPDIYGATIQDILQLIREKKSLAAKRLSETKAHGFYKLAFDGQDYSVNNTVSSETEVKALISGWLETKRGEYLITVFIEAHSFFDAFWNESPSTVRVLVTREQGQLPKIVHSYLRFATKDTGVVNIPGGVYCRVDSKSGSFYDGQTYENDGLQDCKLHPDTKVLLEGVLPHWNLILEKILEISVTIPQIRYMGYDVIITNDGFKIIEVNSHPGIDYFQTEHPYLRDELTRDFFKGLLEEKMHK